jgi:hypothetical protein
MRIKTGKIQDYIHMNITVENTLSGERKDKQFSMVNDKFTFNDQVRLQLSPVEEVVDGWTY